MKDIKNTILQKFREVYGEGEAHAFFAPGRVNLIGEHTDYNGGHVFPCALTIGTYAVARKRNDRKLRFFSMNFEHLGIITSSLDDLKPCREAGWTNYPKGIIWALGQRGYEINEGIDLLLFGNIPNRSGIVFFCICRGGYRLYFERIVWTWYFKSGFGADRPVFGE